MPRHGPVRLCTPLSEWPAADRAAWEQALLPADPFEPLKGYAHRWSARHRLLIEYGYGRWLGWLARSNRLDAGADATTRVTPESVKTYRLALGEKGLADTTIANALHHLANTVRAFDPTAEWDWLYLAVSRIRSRAKLRRDPLKLTHSLEEVLVLGQRLLAAAETSPLKFDTERAIMFRDGLIIAFLIQRPVRKSNLASLTLGRHVEKLGDCWSLRITGDETKNGESIIADWPANLVAALERYLSHYRPILLDSTPKPAAPTDALWVSAHGGAMAPVAIYTRIVVHTKEAFGIAINPHAFRHIAATTIATSNPTNYLDVKGVLGQLSIKTSEKYYNRATMVAAGEVYHGTLKDYRRKSRR